MFDRSDRRLRAPDSGTAPGGNNGDVRLPPDALAILPVREAVLFPGAVLPLAVNRQVSIAAVQHAMRDGQQIGVLMQRDPEVQDPTPADLHRVGTVANVLRMVTTPDGTHQLVCQGVQRFRVLDWLRERPFIAAGVYRLEEPDTRTPEVEARFLNLKRQAAEALQLLPQAPEGLATTIQALDTPAALADLAAALLDVPPDEKQEMLETVDLVARLDRVSRALAGRIEVLRLTAEIGRQTRASLDQRQREAIPASRWPPSSASSARTRASPPRSRSWARPSPRRGCRRRWSRPRARSCAGWSGCRKRRPSTAWSAPTSTG
jgi:ATP-dependent Lon protease